MVVCGYCGQTSYVNIGHLTAAGGSPVVLADYGSVLAVGKRGSVKTKDFEVLGRLRFDYEDGFWDEWLVLLDGEPDTETWLQEDEGEFTLFRRVALENPPRFEELTVGNETSIRGEPVFVTEKSRATISGGEGELPFRIVRGEKADYADGIVAGKRLVASLEYMPEGTVFNVGEPLEFKDLKVK